MKRNLLIALVCGLICTLSAFTALAAPKIVKLGHIMPEAHPNGQAFIAFKQKFEELTKGAYDVQLYHNGQLGDEKQLFESMKLGVGQMSLPNVAVVGNVNKKFSLLTFPYIFPTPEIGLTVCDGPWGQALHKELEPLGYVGLGFLEVGARNVTNNVRPVTKLEDFKGLKLRVMQNPVILNIFRTLGANPTAMAWEEVFSALQQNVIDGQENPLGHIPAFKLYEVQKYLSITQHALTLNSIVIDKGFYTAMSEQDRAALHEAIAYMKDFHKKAKTAGDIAALEEIKTKSKMEVNELTPEERARIRATALPQVEIEAKKIDPAAYDSLLKAIAAAEKK